MEKYIRLACCLLWLAFAPADAFGQIGMGGSAHPSAALDLKSTDKAFYPPRLTTAARLALANPQPGAMVFDTDKISLYLYDGINWQPIAFTTPGNQLSASVFATDGMNGDNFGLSVAVSGDYAVIGAPDADIVGNTNQGAAYVFLRNSSGWTQQAKLTANDGASSDNFGQSVAISGSYVVVGAHRDDTGANTDQGSAYVFIRSSTTWTQQAKLLASDGAASDNFGESVAIDGDYVIVGAPTDDNGANTNQGSAYVFLRSSVTWSQQAKLLASDGAADDSFGNSVSISGIYGVVGAYRDDNGIQNSQGSAYVFIRSGVSWSQQARLVANDGTANDNFGESVGIAGNYIVVGSPGDDNAILLSVGSAYVFFRSGVAWSQQAKLTATDGVGGDSFGISVAISGDYILVGATGLDLSPGISQGGAYAFLRSGTLWSQVRRIIEPDGESNGFSASLSSGRFLIGGPNYSTSKGKVVVGSITD